LSLKKITRVYYVEIAKVLDSGKMKVLALLGFLSVAAALHDSTINVDSFTGFQVYRIQPKNAEDVTYMRMLENRPIYDFWTEITLNRNVDIMVPPQFHKQMEADLAARGLSFEVIIPDVQELIENEKVKAVSREKASADHAMTWDEYHTLDDMYSYLDYLEATYDFVSTESIGSTSEGRDMRVAKICKGGCGGKKAVWIDGGIHAREWISPATVTWMLRELVENDAEHSDLTETLDW